MKCWNCGATDTVKKYLEDHEYWDCTHCGATSTLVLQPRRTYMGEQGIYNPMAKSTAKLDSAFD